MSICTTTELAAALGSGTLYETPELQLVCDAADDVLIPMIWKNEYFAIGHSNTGTTGTLYFDSPVIDIFYVGQTVTVANGGAHYNGSHVITKVGDYTIQYTTDHLTDTPYHPYQPYAIVNGSEYLDYAEEPAIREAALYIAVDIWIGRQQSVMGGMAVDGVPISYRPGALLLAKVRSLIAPYLAPGSMVG